ncbi:zinc-ribbon domain-containing protein [bacterium]|nr:zinc-ribbon domain-containing protein [bacterium]
MKIKCPKCSKVLNVPANLAGQVVKCPCGQTLQTRAAPPSRPNSQTEQSLFDSLPATQPTQQVSSLFTSQLQQVKLQAGLEQERQVAADKRRKKTERKAAISKAIPIAGTVLLIGLVGGGSYFLASGYKTSQIAQQQATQNSIGGKSGGFKPKYDANSVARILDGLWISTTEIVGAEVDPLGRNIPQHFVDYASATRFTYSPVEHDGVAYHGTFEKLSHSSGTWARHSGFVDPDKLHGHWKLKQTKASADGGLEGFEGEIKMVFTSYDAYEDKTASAWESNEHTQYFHTITKDSYEGVLKYIRLDRGANEGPTEASDGEMAMERMSDEEYNRAMEEKMNN